MMLKEKFSSEQSRQKYLEEYIPKWKESVKSDSLEYLNRVVEGLIPHNTYCPEFVQICREEILRRLHLDRMV